VKAALEYRSVALESPEKKAYFLESQGVELSVSEIG
jgi:hypothetical protein